MLKGAFDRKSQGGGGQLHGTGSLEGLQALFEEDIAQATPAVTEVQSGPSERKVNGAARRRHQCRSLHSRPRQHCPRRHRRNPRKTRKPQSQITMSAEAASTERAITGATSFHGRAGSVIRPDRREGSGRTRDLAPSGAECKKEATNSHQKERQTTFSTIVTYCCGARLGERCQPSAIPRAPVPGIAGTRA